MTPFLGLVLLLCNHGNHQGKSGQSLPGSARGKKNVKSGEGRELTCHHSSDAFASPAVLRPDG